MDDKTDAQVNGMLFGQAIAEHILGLGALSRRELNARYRETYREIADGSLTLTDSFAELMQRLAKDVPIETVPQEALDELAALRSALQQTQRRIAQRILDVLRRAES